MENVLGKVHEGPQILDRERVIRMLVAYSYIPEQGQELSVPVFIGVILFKDGGTTRSVVERADALLSESKATGRNRLILG